MRAVSRLTPTTLHILGLCPLAVMADSLDAGLALGLAALATRLATVVFLSGFSAAEGAATRVAAGLVVAAASAAVIQLLYKTFLFESYATNGAFLALVIASGVLPAAVTSDDDSLRVTPTQVMQHGAVMAVVLILVGGLRQSTGASFLPAGAFFALALLTAARGAVATAR